MIKFIRLRHLDDCDKWWWGFKSQGREGDLPNWKMVTAKETNGRNYCLDIKRPHAEEEGHGDPEELNSAEAEIKAVCDQFKPIFSEALLR